MTRWSRRAAGCLLLLCVAGVLVIGFGPFASPLDGLTVRVLDFFSTQVPIVPAGTSPGDIGLLLNIAFFVPVGASLAWWLGEHWGWAMPIALALSATLEVGQYVVSRIGRDASLDDIACNAIGAAAGVVVVAVLRSQRRD
jgi:glycopeptide antibiotics resistance protein